MSDSRSSVIQAVEAALSRLKLSGKKLTETEIPEDVYASALKMVLSVKYNERYSNNRLFTLLVKRGETLKSMDIKQAPDIIRKWQNSLKLLLRYPMDLYIAPNRPELKTVKLTAGFYEYHINRPLTNAKEFLAEMGYQPHPRSLSDYVLKDTSKLVPTITDLIVLHQDLTATTQICEAVVNNQMSRTVSGRIVMLTHVLNARQQSVDTTVMGCVGHLMHNLSHDQYIDTITKGGQHMEHNNSSSTGPPRSLVSRSSVDCDGQSSMSSVATPPAIKPRKNLHVAGVHSHSFDTLPSTSGDSFITSPPPDPSQLPPPVLTQSELMLMFESKPDESPHRDSQPQEETVFPPHQGPPPRDMDSQIYQPFKKSSYEPVMFSIDGRGHDPLKEEEVWNKPQQQQDYPPTNTRNTSYSSFHHREPPRRSSAGNILEQSTSLKTDHSSKFYSPPTVRSTQSPHHPVSAYHCGDASYGQHLQSLTSHIAPVVNNSDYGRQQQQMSRAPLVNNAGEYNNQQQQPVSHAPVVNSSYYGRQQQQPASRAPVVNVTNAGYNEKNLDGPQYSNTQGRSQHTKNVRGYLQHNNYQLYPTGTRTGTNTGATSSTWGGENHRQYIKQMSDPRSTSSQSSIDAMDLAKPNNDPYNPRPWKCYRCQIDYGSETMGCGECGELAPFIDLDGTPDMERKKEQPPAKKQQRREEPSSRNNQIATDRSSYRNSPNSNLSQFPPSAKTPGPSYSTNNEHRPLPAATRGGSNYPVNTQCDSNYSPSSPVAATRGADRQMWECVYCLTENYGDSCIDCLRPK